MRKKDIKTYSKKDLKNILQEKRESLRVFKFSLAMGKVKNVKEAREARKDIARVLTQLRG